MKLNLISFLGISLLISAALTPVVCEIIIYFFGSLPYPFSRVFDRVILAVALILMASNAPAIKKGAISSQIRLAVSKISESTVGFLVSAISAYRHLYLPWRSHPKTDRRCSLLDTKTSTRYSSSFPNSSNRGVFFPLLCFKEASIIVPDIYLYDTY